MAKRSQLDDPMWDGFRRSVRLMEQDKRTSRATGAMWQPPHPRPLRAWWDDWYLAFSVYLIILAAIALAFGSVLFLIPALMAMYIAFAEMGAWRLIKRLYKKLQELGEEYDA